METFTYKTVGDLEIKADVYGFKDDAVRPVAIWIHGGGLILGNRSWMNLRARKLLSDAGYLIVSIDHRLAPESKLPDIVSDVDDALRWVREKGPELFHADPRRLAVMGTSAGAYMALMTGYRADPPPAAIVSFWGYGDPLGDWMCRPSEYYRRQMLVTRSAARRGIGSEPITDGHRNEQRRRDFYVYSRQYGLWAEAVAGIETPADADKIEPYLPIKHITPEFPPTMLIHGTEDEEVPFEQSKLLADEMTRQRVDHRFIAVPGAGHTLAGGDPKLVHEVYAELVPFLDRHLKGE